MNRKKIILPILVVFVCSVLTVLLVKFGRRAQPIPLEPVDPVVEVLRVKLAPKVFEVQSQGTVRASTSIPLMSELDGVVTKTASSFQQGSFFSRGDILLHLDATDYEALVAQAESQLAGARLKLETIKAESKLARQDWEALSSQFVEGATPLLLREPQLKEAEAMVRSAEATLIKARKDLERTRIRAPFDGRIMVKSVDRGQFVRRGQELARVFDVSKMEVQLPVAVSELAFLDPRLGVPDGGGSVEPVQVMLTSDYAGGEHTWKADINRTSGGLDERSRMISLIAEVNDPFGLAHGEHASAPLQVGTFVKARIQGVEQSATFVVPRSAIVRDNQLMLVDEDNRIRFREVSVIQYAGDEAVIGSGLNEGEVVCVSSLEIPMEGVKVNPVFQNSEDHQ